MFLGIDQSTAVLLMFSVDGTPRPAGSKRAFVPRGRNGQPIMRNGRIITTVVDDNAKSRDWKTDVSIAARAAWGARPLLDGPLQVSMTFRRRRPKGHYGSGRNAGVLKPNAEPYPISKPDALKLARGVEDALTGVVWVDDAQIVREVLWKVYVGQSEREGVDVQVCIAAKVDQCQ